MYSLVYWLTVVIATAFLFIMCAGYLVICAGFLVKLFQKRNFKFGEPWGLFAKTNRSAIGIYFSAVNHSPGEPILNGSRCSEP